MRHEFSRKTKNAAWDRCHLDGAPCCEGILPNGSRCARFLEVGRVQFDHIDPDWFSANNALANCQVLGRCCYTPKNARDVGHIAKSKRIRDKHRGTFVRRSTLPCGRNSKYKKKITGEVVLR